MLSSCSRSRTITKPKEVVVNTPYPVAVECDYPQLTGDMSFFQIAEEFRLALIDCNNKSKLKVEELDKELNYP